MASRLHLKEVVEHMNDSDWYNSGDDLVGDDQDGDLDFDISGRDPLDKAADEAEDRDEGDMSAQSLVHVDDALEDDNHGTDDNTDMDNLPQSGQQPMPNTTSQQASHSPTDSWDLDDLLPVPGPTLLMEPDSHPYKFFCKVWGEETFQELAKQSNLYASQKGTTTRVDMNEEEMRSFLGIHLAMGLVQLPSLKDYWSTNPLLATPGIVKGMSRNRFRSILSHLMSTTTPKCPNQDPRTLTSCISLGHSSAKSASIVKEDISYTNSFPLMKLWCYSRAEAPSGNICPKSQPSGDTNAGAYAMPQMVTCIVLMYTRGQVGS